MSAQQWHTDVLERVPGVTYRKLDYWCRVGVLKPSIGATGSGSRRSFSDDDIRCLQAIERASRANVGRFTLMDLATRVRESPNARFAVIRPIARSTDDRGRRTWRGFIELVDGPCLVDDLAFVVPLGAAS